MDLLDLVKVSLFSCLSIFQSNFARFANGKKDDEKRVQSEKKEAGH